MRYSNPRQFFGGDRLGVSGDKPSPRIAGPADARRSLNRTRRIVANFRVAPCLDGGNDVRLQAGNGQYVVAVNNGGGEVLANRAQPGPWGRFTLVDADGGCLRSGDVVHFRTTDGFYLRMNDSELPGFVDATQTYESDYSNFTIFRKNGRGPIRSGDFITLFSTWRDAGYIRAEGGGGGRLLTASAADGPWETFRISIVLPR